VRADDQVLLDARDREIARLQQALKDSLQTQKLDAELERLRSRLDARLRGVEELKARGLQAEALAQTVAETTTRREHQLEVTRARAAAVNTQLNTMSRKLAKQQAKLDVALSRHTAIKSAANGTSNGMESSKTSSGGGKGKGKAGGKKIAMEELEQRNQALAKDNAGLAAELHTLRAQVERLRSDNDELTSKVWIVYAVCVRVCVCVWVGGWVWVWTAVMTPGRCWLSCHPG